MSKRNRRNRNPGQEYVDLDAQNAQSNNSGNSARGNQNNIGGQGMRLSDDDVSRIADKIKGNTQPVNNGNKVSLGMILLSLFSLFCVGALVGGYTYFVWHPAGIGLSDPAPAVAKNLTIDEQAQNIIAGAPANVSSAEEQLDDVFKKIEDAEIETNPTRQKALAKRADDMNDNADGYLDDANDNIKLARSLVESNWPNKPHTSLKLIVKKTIDNVEEDRDEQVIRYDEAKSRIDNILNPQAQKPGAVNTQPPAQPGAVNTQPPAQPAVVQPVAITGVSTKDALAAIAGINTTA